VCGGGGTRSGPKGNGKGATLTGTFGTTTCGSTCLDLPSRACAAVQLAHAEQAGLLAALCCIRRAAMAGKQPLHLMHGRALIRCP
jgi:hypothetical protein